MQPLSLDEAIALAQGAGATARLLAGVTQGTTQVLVALRSGDPASELHLVKRSGYSQEEVPLENRSQSGPERWDYSLSVPKVCDRYVLRLVRDGRVRDIPVDPAMHALLHAHGWNDDAATRLAEPLVPHLHLHRALANLEGGE